MSTSYEIPLISSQAQKLNVTLAGVSYNLTLKWCDPNSAWNLDIADSNDNPILNGIPIIPGVDLLAQYGYLNFGGQLFAQVDHDPIIAPSFDDLGDTGHIFFVTTP